VVSREGLCVGRGMLTRRRYLSVSMMFGEWNEQLEDEMCGKMILTLTYLNTMQ
jgi:hypothetical protein